MIVNKLASRMLIQTRIMMKFSGGHHHHVYDWRDDHAQNPDFYDDPRMVGIRSAQEYVTPYKEDKPLTWDYSHPDSYNQKDLTTTYSGTNHFGVIANYPEVNKISILGSTNWLCCWFRSRVGLRKWGLRLPSWVFRIAALQKARSPLDVDHRWHSPTLVLRRWIFLTVLARSRKLEISKASTTELPRRPGHQRYFVPENVQIICSPRIVWCGCGKCSILRRGGWCKGLFKVGRSEPAQIADLIDE